MSAWHQFCASKARYGRFLWGNERTGTVAILMANGRIDRFQRS